MISKKYIKDLEFENIEEFFNYVLESKINGNYTQTKEFIKKMNKEQYLYFLNWLSQFDFIEYEHEFIKMRLED